VTETKTDDQKTRDGEVLTSREAADYLKITEKKILRMARKGQIPAARVAGEWRFMRTMIDDWLIAQMKVIPDTDLAAVLASGTDLLPISRLTSGDFIKMDIRPGSKEEVLRQLIAPLVRSGLIPDEHAFISKLLEREGMVSTSVGRGAAIPHLRNPEENPSGLPDLLIGICREGTDFESADGDKTHLFFLLLTDSKLVHLRIMAKIGYILRRPDLVSRLVAAEDRDEVLRLLIEADQQMLMT